MKKPRVKGIVLLFILLYSMFGLLLAQNLLELRNGTSAQTILSLALTAVLFILIIVATVLFQRGVKVKIQTDAVKVSVMQQQYLDQLDDPYAILDSTGRILWYNRRFDGVFGQVEGFPGKSYFDLIGTQIVMPPSDVYPTETQLTCFGRIYFVRLQMIKREEDQKSSLQMYAVSMRDITREVELEQENLDIRTDVCLLYVDNYDSIFAGLDEGRKPLMEAMIYRRINDMGTRLNGILTRLEKDRFFLVFPHKYLAQLENERFAVLEEVRKLNIGNTLPLTLSVGVGVADRLSRAQEFARAAVELAMGRGGDQAVVKNEEKYFFFGGNTSGVEKNTRVRARLIAYALRELIDDSDRVLIMGHKNPDLDCFGAALGMFRIITELKKPAHIVMDDNYPAVEILYKRVQLERDYADIIINEQKAREYSGETTLVVILDVNRPSILQCADLLDRNKNIAVIDHHRASADHVRDAALSYVEPYASSTCEMVTEILQYIAERIRLKPVEADGLFAGMELDTRNFTVKTGVRTFEAAAYLRRNGADAVRIRKLFRNNMQEYKARAHIVSQAAIYSKTIAISHWDGAGLENAATVAAQAADDLLSIVGIQASFVLTDQRNLDQVSISARSLGEFNVQVIMEQLGGGGHLMMAGAQLKNVNMEQALSALYGAVDTCIRERR